MKLIIAPLEEWQTYVSREFSYVISDLVATYGWQHIESNKLWTGSLQEQLIDEFGELPETILFYESYELLQARAREIYRLGCRKFLFADDLHWWIEEWRQRKLVSFALCDGVLSTYGYAWNKFFPEFCETKKVVWVPHSASPDFMLQYNAQPDNSILLSGAVNRFYPLRQQMKALHANGAYAISYHDHPGYFTGYDYDNDRSIGRGYANTINRHRAAFTDSLTFGYVVAKYFEIPATGALLLAENVLSDPLRELGFIENVHYVPVSQENMEEQIQYVLDEKNHEELDQIRRNGQKLVWDRHKTTDRARQIDIECSV
ncbi:MAG TPA: glycosyltransferase [Pyrinomonadaceae bacterium]|jgi:hypothetical protein|nr:glycosyltransferase [Pyrinomonadaceae bacterium]